MQAGGNTMGIGSCTSCSSSIDQQRPQRGLERTAEAISTGQQRFDASVERVVDATEQLASGEVDDGTELTQAAVDVRMQSLENQLMYAAYQRQAEQQRDLMQALR
jgi:hypothetical protein